MRLRQTLPLLVLLSVPAVRGQECLTQATDSLTAQQTPLPSTVHALVVLIRFSDDETGVYVMRAAVDGRQRLAQRVTVVR
jgi:hypothetical protein